MSITSSLLQMPLMPTSALTTSFANLDPEVEQPKKNKNLSMLSRLTLAQWPVGEVRGIGDFITLELPNGEKGSNRASATFYAQALLLGYIESSGGEFTMRYSRTNKLCKLPKSAQKRDGRFPISQEVHQCLLWGHPIWAQLNWAEKMNPRSADIRAMQLTLRPYQWLGAKFGKLRWALGKYLLEGHPLPRHITDMFGSDIRVICGMLRIGLTPKGTMRLLSGDAGRNLVMEALSRDQLFERLRLVE